MRWPGKSRKEPKTIAFSVADNLPTLAQVILRRVPFSDHLARTAGKIDQDIQRPGMAGGGDLPPWLALMQGWHTEARPYFSFARSKAV
jgi:hypothetical protein